MAPISHQQKHHILAEWKHAIEAAENKLAAIDAVIGLSVDGALCDIVHRLMMAYTNAIAQLVGDKSEWLQWYWLDNGMGESGREVAIDGTTRRIYTIDDLLWCLG